MRNSIVLLCILILAVAAGVALWFLRGMQPSIWVARTETIRHATVRPIRLRIETPASSVPTPVFPVTQAPQQKVLQISVAETSALEQRTADWWSARGCESSETLQNLGKPPGVLRSEVLNDDLTAVNQLAFDLIFDPKEDGRARAKPILRRAVLQGSVCAIANYYFVTVNWRRKVTRNVRDQLAVNYTPVVPPTSAGKRAAVMDAYAWDLVYQIRTGIATTPTIAYSIESAYHFYFQPTPAEYAQACGKAVGLYNGLLMAREAAGYGPFDDSPPPILPRVVVSLFGRKQQPRCANSPVPAPQCQKAEFHSIDRAGEIEAVEGWLCSTGQSGSSENPMS